MHEVGPAPSAVAAAAVPALFQIAASFLVGVLHLGHHIYRVGAVSAELVLLPIRAAVSSSPGEFRLI